MLGLGISDGVSSTEKDWTLPILAVVATLIMPVSVGMV